VTIRIYPAAGNAGASAMGPFLAAGEILARKSKRPQRQKFKWRRVTEGGAEEPDSQSHRGAGFFIKPTHVDPRFGLPSGRHLLPLPTSLPSARYFRVLRDLSSLT